MKVGDNLKPYLSHLALSKVPTLLVYKRLISFRNILMSLARPVEFVM